MNSIDSSQQEKLKLVIAQMYQSSDDEIIDEKKDAKRISLHQIIEHEKESNLKQELPRINHKEKMAFRV